MIRRILILLALLIPSALFCWRNRDMPQFAYLHDDGLMFVSAQSLAAGEGYRIASLPEQPAQTKYPPLYTAYLALIWLVNPHFPDNLRLATLACWICLFACLLVAYWLYRIWDLSERQALALTAILALNPYMVWFGGMMFSEMFFTVWILLAFAFLERKWFVAAGIAAGCAYLSRTAGIALLIAAPAFLLWKRQGRAAFRFAAAMLPFIAAWMLWSRAHLHHTTDLTLMYYTDYLGYEFKNVGFDNIHMVVWKNLDELLYGAGSLVTMKLIDAQPMKILTEVMAIAMIAGVVRLFRRGVGQIYAIFALISAGMLIVWHFPPNERFVLPLFPLLAAGLLEEASHLAAMVRSALRHKDRSQRVAAGFMAACAAAVLLLAAGSQLYMTFDKLSQAASGNREKLAALRPAYSWISAHVPPGDPVLSYDDPLLYLYTGHRGNFMMILPRWWYTGDQASITAAYNDLAGYASRRGFKYLYLTSDDLGRDGTDQISRCLRPARRTGIFSRFTTTASGRSMRPCPSSNFFVLILAASGAFGQSVKANDAELRTGCDADSDVVAKLPPGTSVAIRYELSGESTPCYKVVAKAGDKVVEGYLNASSLDGLDGFEKERTEAAWLDTTEIMGAIHASDRMPSISAGRAALASRASELIQISQPVKALQILDPALKKQPDATLLALAGVAAWRADDPGRALDYWHSSLALAPNPEIERLVKRVEKETEADKSVEKLYGARVILRYDPAAMPVETAREVVATLDQEYARISSKLGCSAEERIVAIVQSRDGYRKATDAAEWNGGQMTGAFAFLSQEDREWTPRSAGSWRMKPRTHAFR